jgi:glycosyltransferase involved in cell wall biosynthesis
MITYKHGEFIHNAVSGVLNQKVNFECELIIADDCSPDHTSEIITDLIKNHPNGHWIKYFRHKKNKGMQANGTFAIQNCTGKYIAICEGDDYWSDNEKLQKQFDFLMLNPEYKFCAHRVKEYHEKKKIFKSIEGNDQDLFINDFLKVGGCAGAYTCSFFFENDVELIQKYLSPWTLNLDGGDFLLLLLFAQKYGKIRILKDQMAVYRIHSGGVWTSRQRGISELKTMRNVNDLIISNLNLTNIEKNLLIYSERRKIYIFCHEYFGSNWILKKLIGLLYKLSAVLPINNYTTRLTKRLAEIIISKR